MQIQRAFKLYGSLSESRYLLGVKGREVAVSHAVGYVLLSCAAVVAGAGPRAWQGYPEEIKELPDYDPNFFQRGLMIDKERGNVIKMDRHSYVKVAYHGTSPLNKEERTEFYGTATQKDFAASQFAPIDTLFSLPDAFMYSQVRVFVPVPVPVPVRCFLTP